MAWEDVGIAIRVDVEGGKYTFLVFDGGRISILRNGKDWIDNFGHIGAKAMIALLSEHERLLQKSRNELPP